MLNPYHSLLGSIRRTSPLMAMAICDHHNRRGAPMSFGTMPFLAPLYHELPNLEGADIISGVQTGKSELFILLMFYLSGWRGRICAYVLPTFHIRSRFVNGRIDPLLQDVPAYRRRVPGGAPGLAPSSSFRGSQAMKLFGPGTMLFLGSNTATDFIEFSADALFIDELDQCEPENIAKARDRILASPYPQLFRLGNPTLPGVGIDKAYNRSDRRRWNYRCPHCNDLQPLDWFVNFVRREDDGRWVPRDSERAQQGRPAPVRLTADTEIVRNHSRPSSGDLRPVCRRCERPFERAETWHSWVPDHPEAGRRQGYRMSRLDVLHHPVRDLFAEWLECQLSTVDTARFFTSNLGMAYEHSGAQMTVEELRAAATGPDNDHVGGPEYKDELVCMGVDVGTVLNVTIDRIRLVPNDDPTNPEDRLVRECVHVGGYSSFEDLDDLIERFHVRTVCIDAQPETRKASELRDRWLGSDTDVWLCRFFPVPKVGRQRFGLQLDWTTRVVNVDRTQVLDAAYDDVRHGGRKFPCDVFSTFGWSDQMRAPKRVLDEARSRIIWTEGSSPDHYRLSDAYALIAMALSQMGSAYHS